MPRPIHPKFADQKVRADHADGLTAGGEDLDIRDHPDGARFRRLRPGIAGAQAEDAVLHAPAIVERDGDLAPRIAPLRRGWHPVEAFRRVESEPLVKAELIEQPRFALQ